MSAANPLLDSGHGVRIFDHLAFSTYFSAYLSYSKRTLKSFSLRYLCRQSGIKSPSMFTWFATGKRLPTPEILERLSEALKWTPAEHAYANLMVNYEKSESTLEKSHLFEKMQAVAVPLDVTTVRDQAKSVFSKWHIMTILEMTHLADFQWDAAWIRNRLGSRVSESDVLEAIETLKDCHFLISEADGSWQRNTKSHRTRDNVAIAAVRGWHSQMMKLAQQAIHIQEPAERFFTGATLTVRSSQLKQAQELIAEFREKFLAMTQTDQGDETYQFAVQFFRLTDGRSAPDALNDDDGPERRRSAALKKAE